MMNIRKIMGWMTLICLNPLKKTSGKCWKVQDRSNNIVKIATYPMYHWYQYSENIKEFEMKESWTWTMDIVVLRISGNILLVPNNCYISETFKKFWELYVSSKNFNDVLKTSG